MFFLTDSAVGTKIQRKDCSWHMAHVGHKALPVRQSLFCSDCWTVSHLILYLNLRLKLGKWACIFQRQSASRASETAIMEHTQQQEGRSRGGEKRRNDNNYIFFKHQWNGSHETKCPGEVSHFISVTALGGTVLYGPFYSDENRGRKHPINYPKSHSGIRAKLRCREFFDFSTLSQTLWGESTRRWVFWECVGKLQSRIPSSQQNPNSKQASADWKLWFTV